MSAINQSHFTDDHPHRSLKTFLFMGNKTELCRIAVGVHSGTVMTNGGPVRSSEEQTTGELKQLILLQFTHRHIILNLRDVIFPVKHESKHNVKALISAFTAVQNLGFGLFCSATLHLYDQKHIHKYEILLSCKIAVFLFDYLLKSYLFL